MSDMLSGYIRLDEVVYIVTNLSLDLSCDGSSGVSIAIVSWLSESVCLHEGDITRLASHKCFSKSTYLLVNGDIALLIVHQDGILHLLLTVSAIDQRLM